MAKHPTWWHPNILSFPVLPTLLCLLSLTIAHARNAPDILLADIYEQGIDVTHYWISEKLDGVRGRWDGTQLISRGGQIYAAPTWFTKDFPHHALDGELWIDRRRYEETSSIVRTHQPHEGWRDIRFMVFDLPAHGGTFEQRVTAMRQLVRQTQSPYLTIIDQFTVSSEEELQQRLQEIIDKGGEGLMLHKKTAIYAAGRSHDLLKLKPWLDAEATVIGYKPGKGKYTGLIGSLLVKTDEGLEFFLGTGLGDTHRRHPPPLQSRITYRHQGFTQRGLPRFPVFLRIRDEEPQ